ncbi:MAG: DUF4921 family protein [Brevinema sp.]
MDFSYKQSIAGMESFYHPFFDLKSLYSPDRKKNIFFSFQPINATINPKAQYSEDFCAFCMGRIKESTPEKIRISQIKDNTLKTDRLCRLEVYPEENVLFRRQGNLFEILPFNYWYTLYNIDSTEHELDQIKKDLSDPILKSYLLGLLATKNKKMGKDPDLSSDDLMINELKPMYSGYHELITSGSHFCQKHADGRVHSTSSMDHKDHRISYHMICDTLVDMLERNKYIQYITVFQNWMHPAGASFDHWHKQILALDFWGDPLERECGYFTSNPNIYEEFAIGTAIKYDLFIAENNHAVAYVEVGSKTGTITICSKSSHLRPFEHTKEEIDSMSDLSHAIISCIGDLTPYNEEWYYTPFNNNNFVTPWRVMINLRSDVSAGFENITQKLICSISPRDLAQQIRNQLQEKITQGLISKNITIHPKNVLLSYGKNK